jgi:predicted nucleic acid-binding protein
LIVAAAFASNATYLLSEDLQDGQDFDGVRVVDPFSAMPDTILAAED